MDNSKTTASDRPPLAMPDGRTLLADGSIMNMADWFHGDYRSAFLIDPYAVDDGHDPVQLFTYGRSQVIPGTGVIAGHAHTNVPRNGDNGLPKDCDVPLEQVVLSFAGAVALRFIYNQKIYREATLLDLLLGRSAILGPEGSSYRPGPIHMRENLSYRVDVMIPVRARLDLAEWQKARMPAPAIDPVILAELEQIGRSRRRRRLARSVSSPGAASVTPSLARAWMAALRPWVWRYS